jgi:hypothetical protein
MPELVSTRWIRAGGLVALILVVGALLVPNGLPWTSLGALSLAFSGALWLGLQSTFSIAQRLGAIDREPARVAREVGYFRSGGENGRRVIRGWERSSRSGR